MGRHKCPEVRQKRENAAKLEAAGLSVEEIALRYGVAASTVRKWLVEARGRKRTLGDRIRELAGQGRNRKEIERLTGAGKATISKALAKIAPPRELTRHCDRVPFYLENARRQQPDFFESWLLEQSACVEFLRFTAEKIEDNAAEGLEDALVTRRVFESQLRRARSLKRERQCNLSGAINLEAAARRTLGQLGRSAKLLTESLVLADGCKACIAELDRENAWLLIYRLFDRKQRGADFSQFSRRAHDLLSSSLSFYQKQKGHSIHEAGEASALFGLASLRYYTDRFEDALRGSRSVLQKLKIAPPKSGSLNLFASHLHAVCLSKVGGKGNLDQAQQLLRGVLRDVKPQTTMIYGKVKWASGQIRSCLGQEPWSNYMDALLILDELQYALEVTSLILDIAYHYKDAAGCKEKISRALWVVTFEDHGRRRLKPYLEEQAGILKDLMRASRDSPLDKAIAALRVRLGCNSMPAAESYSP